MLPLLKAKYFMCLHFFIHKLVVKKKNGYRVAGFLDGAVAKILYSVSEAHSFKKYVMNNLRWM